MQNYADFNLDEIFADAESETSFNSLFLKVAKGENITLVLLPPMLLNGTPKIIAKVKSTFRKDGEPETVSDQIIMRVLTVQVQKDKSIIAEEVKGIQLSFTMFKEILKLREADYPLGEVTSNILILSHDGKKRSVMPTQKTFTVSQEFLELGEKEISWEILLAEHDRMQELGAKPKKSIDSASDKLEALFN